MIKPKSKRLLSGARGIKLICMRQTQITSKDVADFKKAAKAYRKRHARTPEEARKELVALGVVTPKGNLKKAYGG